MDTVSVDGVTYVRAQDAAKAIGYTADYVGQLCRKDKVDARQIGRTWYVREGALEEHKKEAARSNVAKTKQSVDHARIESAEESGHIHKSVYMPEYKKRLLDTKISYENDATPLVPNVVRSTVSTTEEDTEEPEETEEGVTISEEEAREAAQRDAEQAYEEEVETEEEEQKVAVRVAEADVEEEQVNEEYIEEEEEAHASANFDVEYAEDVVPDREYTRPRAGSFISATVLAGMLFFVLATAFVQNLWTYQAGSGEITQQLYFETTYSVSAVANVVESLSR